jgi:hypothetical protein
MSLVPVAPVTLNAGRRIRLLCMEHRGIYTDHHRQSPRHLLGTRHQRRWLYRVRILSSSALEYRSHWAGIHAYQEVLFHVPGSGFASDVWTMGASTRSITVCIPGAYGVTVTNSSGCSGHDSILVGSGASVSLGRDTCVRTGGSIVLSAGAGFSSYHWSTGASTALITVSSAGTDAVTVSAGGCQAHDSRDSDHMRIDPSFRLHTRGIFPRGQCFCRQFYLCQG